MNLKDKHKKALELIRRELSAGRRFPTLQDIAQYTEAKHRSVAKSYLNVLIEKKLISRDAKSGQYILSNFARRFEYIDSKSTYHHHDESTEPFFVDHTFFNGTDLKVFKVLNNKLMRTDGIRKDDFAVINENEPVQINSKGIFLRKLKNGSFQLQKNTKIDDSRNVKGKLVGVIRKLKG